MTMAFSRIATLGALAALCAVSACGDDAAPADDTTTGSGTDPDTGMGTELPPMSTSTGSGAVDSTGEDSGSDSSTGGEPLTRIEEIVFALDRAMYECPDVVWPGLSDDYRSAQILLVSESEGIAYLWNDQSAAGATPTVTELDYASLDAEWHTTFNIGMLDGVITLGISLDTTAETNASFDEQGLPRWHDFAIELAFHEGFHFLHDQGSWDVDPGSRSIPYPEPWEPRYLRAMLGWAVRDQLEAGGAPDMSAAAYWRARALAEYPQEMAQIEPYDITEGTAEYASAMMSAVVDLGCDATDEELVAAVVEHLDVFASLDHYAGGREPYDLGVLFGTTLRRQGAKGWEALAEQGYSLHLMAIGATMAQMQAEDATRQAEAMAAADQRNVVAGEQIEPMLANMADPAYYRVPLPFDWISGSFSLGGFYYLVDEPGVPNVMLGYTALHTTPTGSEVTVDGLTLIHSVAHPCPLTPGSVIATVPVADVTDNGDGTFTSSNASLSFANLTATTLTDAQTLPWMCADTAAAPAAPPRRSLPRLGVLPGPGGRPQLVDL